MAIVFKIKDLKCDACGFAWTEASLAWIANGKPGFWSSLDNDLAYTGLHNYAHAIAGYVYEKAAACTCPRCITTLTSTPYVEPPSAYGTESLQAKPKAPKRSLDDLLD